MGNVGLEGGAIGATGLAGTGGLEGITRASTLGFSSTGALTAVMFSGVSVRTCNSAFFS